MDKFSHFIDTENGDLPESSISTVLKGMYVCIYGHHI